MRCVIQVIGPSDSGKTSAIVMALKMLRERGVSATVVKHTHHEIDTPHKDSWRFINEGMAESAIVIKGSGEAVLMIMRNLSVREAMDLAPSELIIVEGFKDLELGERVTLPSSRSLEEVAAEIAERALSCLRSRGAI